MKQRQLEGIKSMADEHVKVVRHNKNLRLGLYAAILEIEHNPHHDPIERERVEKLI